MWLSCHYDMEWVRWGFWVSDCGFVSGCLNKQCPASLVSYQWGLIAWVLWRSLGGQLIWARHSPSFPDHCIWIPLTVWPFSSVQFSSFCTFSSLLLSYSVYLRNSHLALQVKQKEGQQSCKPRLGTLKCNAKICYKIKSNRCWILL